MPDPEHQGTGHAVARNWPSPLRGSIVSCFAYAVDSSHSSVATCGMLFGVVGVLGGHGIGSVLPGASAPQTQLEHLDGLREQGGEELDAVDGTVGRQEPLLVERPERARPPRPGSPASTGSVGQLDGRGCTGVAGLRGQGEAPTQPRDGPRAGPRRARGSAAGRASPPPPPRGRDRRAASGARGGAARPRPPGPSGRRGAPRPRRCGPRCPRRCARRRRPPRCPRSMSTTPNSRSAGQAVAHQRSVARLEHVERQAGARHQH